MLILNEMCVAVILVLEAWSVRTLHSIWLNKISLLIVLIAQVFVYMICLHVMILND